MLSNFYVIANFQTLSNLSAAVVAVTGIAGSMTAHVSAAPLPGGASSLTEIHGDWTVNCRVPQGGATKPDCVMSQQKVNQQKKRAIAIELRPDGEAATGVLVLPFGIAVTEKVNLAVGEEVLGDGFAFSTCLATGCIVPLSFNADAVGAFQRGDEITVTAKTLANSDLKLTVSLAGFTNAFARVRELTTGQQ
jgi:invasion protein IalB